MKEISYGNEKILGRLSAVFYGLLRLQYSQKGWEKTFLNPQCLQLRHICHQCLYIAFTSYLIVQNWLCLLIFVLLIFLFLFLIRLVFLLFQQLNQYNNNNYTRYSNHILHCYKWLRGSWWNLQLAHKQNSWFRYISYERPLDTSMLESYHSFYIAEKGTTSS
jgi:hypothetical protein